MHMIFIYMTHGTAREGAHGDELLVKSIRRCYGVHFTRGYLARLDADYERALRIFERMVRSIQ